GAPPPDEGRPAGARLLGHQLRLELGRRRHLLGHRLGDVRGDAFRRPLARLQPGGRRRLLVRAGRPLRAHSRGAAVRGEPPAVGPDPQRQRPLGAGPGGQLHPPRPPHLPADGGREARSARPQVLLDRRHAAVEAGDRHRLRGDHREADLDHAAAPRPDLLPEPGEARAARPEARQPEARRSGRGMSDSFALARERMVRDLAAKRGIRDPRVLEAMRRVPRHLFVKEGTLPHLAYADRALSIGEQQTISQPSIVARMTERLEVTPESSVLEIGTGSGYQTAVLALLARRVFSLERVAPLARGAIARLRELGLEKNVKIQIFDGTVGWSDVAPFDRILVTAAAPKVPDPLLDQLAPG